MFFPRTCHPRRSEGTQTAKKEIPHMLLFRCAHRESLLIYFIKVWSAWQRLWITTAKRVIKTSNLSPPLFIEEVDSKRSFEDGGVGLSSHAYNHLLLSPATSCKPAPLIMRSTWNVFSAQNVHPDDRRDLKPRNKRFLTCVRCDKDYE